MSLAVFSANSRVTAAVPSLTGGIDRSRDAARIADNALSDGDNVWWCDGALRTRPGFVTASDRKGWVGAGASTRFYTDREGMLLSLTVEEYDSTAAIGVEVFDKTGAATGVSWVRDELIGTRAFCVPAGGSTADYTTLLFFSSGVIIGVHPARGVFEDITDQAYQPLLMVNGTPVTSRADTTPNGVLYESRNRLTERFRCQFTSDGAGTYYYLPVQSLWGMLTVTVTRSGGDTAYVVGSGSDSSIADSDGLQVRVDRAAGCFWFGAADGTTRILADTGLRNNVTVEAGAAIEGIQPFDMAFGVWYGGDRSSSVGGTRLFLGGSTAAPAVALWSALDDPLYFPHSSYAVVGTPGEPLTAFGKQGGLLVLFKEREIYTAEYVAGDEVDGEDLEAGLVTDVTAAAATFPLTPLHTGIGCDQPQTVALPGNRLVWACRDGTVYTLSSVSSLNQRCVTRLSAAIQPLLRENGSPAVAAAAALDGRYYLLWDDRILVMEENDTSVWHRFSWPDNGAVPVGIGASGERLLLPALCDAGEGGSGLFWFSADGGQDTILSRNGSGYFDAVYTFSQQPVEGRLCTKAYDMGEPEAYKSVLGIAVEITADGTVSPAYVTERGRRADRPHRPAADGLLRLTPNLTRCRRLALELTGRELCVGSVTLQLRTGMR